VTLSVGGLPLAAGPSAVIVEAPTTTVLVSGTVTLAAGALTVTVTAPPAQLGAATALTQDAYEVRVVPAVAIAITVSPAVHAAIVVTARPAVEATLSMSEA
jgi:hypothetical protein